MEEIKTSGRSFTDVVQSPQWRLYESFAQSSYGEELRQRTRFWGFQPEQMSNQAWANLLGPDVDNLQHMLLSLCITEGFIEVNNRELSKNHPSYITEDEQEILRYVAVAHDFGEAIVGDLPYGTKNGDDEKDEIAAMKKIFGEVPRGVVFSQETQDSITHILEVDPRNDPHPPKLAKMFNAIEKIGYTLTAIFAYREAQSPDNNHIRNNLNNLAFNVFSRQIPELLDYAEQYPAVEHFLRENTSTITQYFGQDIDVSEYGTDMQDGYDVAKSRWYSSIIYTESA